MTVDLNDLEAKARAATPGPWFFNSYSTIFSKPGTDAHEAAVQAIPDDAPDDDPRWAALPAPYVAGVPVSHGDTGTVQGRKDAQFIEAANPLVVLELIAMVRAAQK